MYYPVTDLVCIDVEHIATLSVRQQQPYLPPTKVVIFLPEQADGAYSDDIAAAERLPVHIRPLRKS